MEGVLCNDATQFSLVSARVDYGCIVSNLFCGQTGKTRGGAFFSLTGSPSAHACNRSSEACKARNTSFFQRFPMFVPSLSW